MALKTLLLKRQLEEKKTRMKELNAKTEELQAREAELELATEEAKTEEDLRAVEELVEAFTDEQAEHRSAVQALQAEIDSAEAELRTLEAKNPTAPSAASPTGQGGKEKRKDEAMMNQRQTRAFGAMTMEQRSVFLQREDVQEFLTGFRTMFSGEQKRSVTGADLLIPTVVLDLIRENIEDYSKLIRRVRLVPVAGIARQPIMGTIPEAVWTEMCASLNELNFTVNQTEVDGYKVGGYVAVCNALLEDSPGLLSELIVGIGAAIGIALDKAILFGTGVKMPLGIATRLAQTLAPSNYPDSARAWVNLSQSNVITIPSGSTTGLTLFQQIVQAAAAAKGRYSRGEKFWAMNEKTFSRIQVESTNINAGGAIVSMLEGTMPVVGGDLVVFGDEIMPDNTIIGGYGDLYLLAERAGTSIGYSDLPLFIQDQTVVKGTARYDGTPVIPEGFVVIGLGAAPATSVEFAPDMANPAVAALQALTLGSLSLTPDFSPETAAYTATTTNASNSISAVPTVGATVEIKANGAKVANGTPITWKSGENTVVLTVKNGTESKAYTVTVTKS